MTHLRFTLAQLMAVVLFIGFGFAALRNAGPLLATATYNLAFLSLPTATVCAVVGQGRLRSLATGYATFGSAYFLFNLLPLRPYNSLGYVQGRPKLLSSRRDSSSSSRISGRCPHRPCKPSSTMT